MAWAYEQAASLNLEPILSIRSTRAVKLIIYRSFKSSHLANCAFTLLLSGNLDLNECETHMIYLVGECH